MHNAKNDPGVIPRQLSGTGRKALCGKKDVDAFRRVEEMEKRVKQAIGKEHLPLLEEFGDTYMNLVDACCEDEFVNGYRIGVQVMMSAWPDSISK